MFKELESHNEKRECLKFVNKNIDNIDRAVFLMKRELQKKHNRFSNKRNKSVGRKVDQQEDKQQILFEEKESLLENIFIFSEMIYDDIHRSEFKDK
jgi:hypothetical protein